MIIDTSAIVAVLLSEPEWATFEDVIDGRNNPIQSRMLDDLISGSGMTISPVTAEQALIARQAYRDFGRGSGHPARLNVGDCFSYAPAKDLNEELLFKVDDFIHTDVRPAIPPGEGSTRE